MGLALSPVLGEASEALRGLGPRTHGAAGTAWATDEMEPRAQRVCVEPCRVAALPRSFRGPSTAEKNKACPPHWLLTHAWCSAGRRRKVNKGLSSSWSLQKTSLHWLFPASLWIQEVTGMSQSRC